MQRWGDRHDPGEHQDQEIGCGHYRKHGQPGRMETSETLSVSGALVGLIEIPLVRRAEEQHKRIQAERTERLIQFACSCEQPIGYDERDHCFALLDGHTITVCPTCGTPLELKRIERERQQRIALLQRELQHQQAALRQIQSLSFSQDE